ncbi:regulator of nonsense transcripts 3B-like [Nycticebus coucang]|uniref:regulator of nonsense transcripts 3B-like n=1 Tax=Nycticebus coucang TaxID=9470 RepID=UPI00234DE27B|nr:regulator of nonsense transcripts 3B-like [Nycticebus coucang]
MKEEKENKPKNKQVTLLTPPGASSSGNGSSGDGAKGEDKHERSKEKKEALSKVVIRRLPPTLTKEQLQKHLQPMPEHDYFEFFSNDTSLYPHLYARAYINFKSQEDIILFRDRFDGYVFLDNKGQEYPAVVEFAPFQKAAKKKTKKRDSKVGTIKDDPDYRKFLESYAGDSEKKITATPETMLEEIEARKKESIAKKTTPLLSFLKNKQRIREEKREERRRREIERKRQREEERRKWKEEEKRKRKEMEKLKKTDRVLEMEKVKDEPKIKLLKKPEKGEEKETDKGEKTKQLDKENVSDERANGQTGTIPKRSDSELKDAKPKRAEEESGKNYKKERDYEREQERGVRERERQKRQEEERRRQKERYEKGRMFKRKEEEMKKEKEALQDKGKKNESRESTGSSDKTEKKEEVVVKKERIRNKDRPSMLLYQAGARSRNRPCPPDDSAKSGDAAAGKKAEKH